MCGVFFKRGGLDELFARHVFKQVVEAACYLHNEQYVQHNDIKPANSLFNDE